MAVYFMPQEDVRRKEFDYAGLLNALANSGSSLASMENSTVNSAEMMRKLGRQDDSYKRMGLKNHLEEMGADQQPQGPGLVDRVKGWFSSDTPQPVAQQSTFREDPTIKSLVGDKSGYVGRVGMGATDAFIGEQVQLPNRYLDGAGDGKAMLTQDGYDLPTGLGKTADWKRSLREPATPAVQPQQPQQARGKMPSWAAKEGETAGTFGQRVTPNMALNDKFLESAVRDRLRSLGPVNAKNHGAIINTLWDAYREQYSNDLGREGHGQADKYLAQIKALQGMRFGGGPGLKTWQVPRSINGTVVNFTVSAADAKSAIREAEAEAMRQYNTKGLGTTAVLASAGYDPSLKYAAAGNEAMKRAIEGNASPDTLRNISESTMTSVRNTPIGGSRSDVYQMFNDVGGFGIGINAVPSVDIKTAANETDEQRRKRILGR